jgi:hypothetical protein
MKQLNPLKARKVFFGILAGPILYVFIGTISLYLLKISWTDYAIASIDKSYTIEMLLCRLAAGIIAAIVTGVVTTKIANDNGRSAWLVGIFVFCVAAFIHFVQIWNDYPAWYHFAYVVPIVPVVGLSGFFIRSKQH